MRLSSTERPRRTAEPPPSLSEGDLKERLLSRIQFPEETAWVKDTPLASTFKEALCDALRPFDSDRLRVRCGVTRDENDALKFMCKVEMAGDGNSSGTPTTHAWSWWSPLVETPAELAVELRKALRQRQERTSVRARAPRPARVDKARGPAHGTWSTELWDLGRSDQGESFCRNRRGRWTAYPSASRPLRPRSPR